jgi:hypothetical protein
MVDLLQCRDHPRFQKIAAMHVDVVLCEKQTMRPVLAIELDDRSHQFFRRRSADSWKAELLRGCRIPLLRQKCQTAYDLAAIRTAIQNAISRAARA